MLPVAEDTASESQQLLERPEDDLQITARRLACRPWIVVHSSLGNLVPLSGGPGENFRANQSPGALHLDVVDDRSLDKLERAVHVAHIQRKKQAGGFRPEPPVHPRSEEHTSELQSRLH